ncbi:MAG TPA: choice-of-anchor B family protein, partial [Planctomycetota bacterium]
MRNPLLAAAFVLFAAAPLAAQGNGVELLAKVDAFGGYNDCWGYTAPDGREYAIIGTSTGTAFYNAVDPTAPYLTGYIPGPNSVWRDMKTWDEFCYVVTEGGGGMQIVDLRDPEKPVLLAVWGDNRWGNAHNIAIDVGTGTAYVCGTNNGTVIIDLTVPTSPVHVTNYTSQYVHDLHVQHGLAHNAEINAGDYRILDVSNLPSKPSIGAIQTPGSFTHSTWANAGDSLCVTTDESGGGHLALYDISTPGSIRLLDQWTINPAATVHNAYIRGDRVYASWYTEGFACVDISDPANMRFVGSYDTNAASGGGYDGAWGCYPFAPSGVVYISDRDEGLHILRVVGQAVAFDHVPAANTLDENGPYPLTASVQALNAGAAIASVDAWYRVGGGSWQSTALAPTGNPDEWAGDLPGQISPTIVDYYLLSADDQGREGWFPSTTWQGGDTFSFVVGRIVPIYENDFEGGTDEGWTHSAIVGADIWERGAPQGKSGTGTRHESAAWADPAAATSGSNVWGTDLGLGGADGAYDADSQVWLESPPIDCSTATRTTLLYKRWLTVEQNPEDSARILVNGQTAWENPAGFVGELHLVDTAWRQHALDISQFADGEAAVRVRFRLKTDEEFQMGG